MNARACLLAVLVAGCAGGGDGPAGAGARASPARAARVELRALATVAGEAGGACEPGDASTMPCGLSGLRLSGGRYFMVSDKGAARVHRVDAAALHHEGATSTIELARAAIETLEVRPSERAGACRTLKDAEAIERMPSGEWVIATDDWQVAWLALEGEGARPQLSVTACWTAPTRATEANTGFEALFLRGATVYALSEKGDQSDAATSPLYAIERVQGAEPTAELAARVGWTRAECEKRVRITDAVATGDGAVVLGSCRDADKRFHYFIGRLDLPTKLATPVVVATSFEIDNPESANLEGLALGPSGQLVAVSDNDFAALDGPTRFVEVPLDAGQRKTLGLP